MSSQFGARGLRPDPPVRLDDRLKPSLGAARGAAALRTIPDGGTPDRSGPAGPEGGAWGPWAGFPCRPRTRRRKCGFLLRMLEGRVEEARAQCNFEVSPNTTRSPRGSVETDPAGWISPSGRSPGLACILRAPTPGLEVAGQGSPWGKCAPWPVGRARGRPDPTAASPSSVPRGRDRSVFPRRCPAGVRGDGPGGDVSRGRAPHWGRAPIRTWGERFARRLAAGARASGMVRARGRAPCPRLFSRPLRAGTARHRSRATWKRSRRRSIRRACSLLTRDSESLVSSPISRIESPSQYLR